MDLFIVIPARSGSKGVLNKNLRIVNGKSLVMHSLEAAIYIKDKYKSNCTICLTSDSNKILDQANFVKKEVVKLERDISLSGDKSLTIDVVLDAATKCKVDQKTIVLLMQPTVPFRPQQELDNILSLFSKLGTSFSSIVSLKDVEGNHPFRYKRVLADGTCISYIDQGFEDMRPRQDLPPCYIRSGSYYAALYEDILSSRSLLPEPTYGFIHQAISPVNIDTTTDLFLAEQQFLHNG